MCEQGVELLHDYLYSSHVGEPGLLLELRAILGGLGLLKELRELAADLFGTEELRGGWELIQCSLLHILLRLLLAEQVRVLHVLWMSQALSLV